MPDAQLLFPTSRPAPTLLGAELLDTFSAGELLSRAELQARLPVWRLWSEVLPELRRLVQQGLLLRVRSKGWRRPGLSTLQRELRDALDPCVWLSTRQIAGAVPAPLSVAVTRSELAHLLALGWVERGHHRGRERWRRR